ncbi:hypothetical protein Tco_0144257 [Tanacetum coccineum]
MDKEEVAPSTVTIKAKIEVVKEIREALTPTQVEIFEKTCFGHWLGVGLKKNSQLLIHTLLTCMVDGKANELSFLVLALFEGRLSKSRDTKILMSSDPLAKVGDEAVHKVLGDRMERAATTLLA